MGINNMNKEKVFSKSSKERFASELKEKKEIEKRRKEGKIRLEDMSDEEHLWYTIRKKWSEEGKEKKEQKKKQEVLSNLDEKQ